MSVLKAAICDDSMLVRKKLKASLEALGVEVCVEATNGEEIVQKLTNNCNVDLLFLDIVMPIKTGIEALTELKANETTKDLKVVMVTSVGTSKHVREAVKLGVYDFMQKPVDVEVLQNILDKAKGE